MVEESVRIELAAAAAVDLIIASVNLAECAEDPLLPQDNESAEVFDVADRVQAKRVLEELLPDDTVAACKFNQSRLDIVVVVRVLELEPLGGLPHHLMQSDLDRG